MCSEFETLPGDVHVLFFISWDQREVLHSRGTSLSNSSTELNIPEEQESKRREQVNVVLLICLKEEDLNSVSIRV